MRLIFVTFSSLKWGFVKKVSLFIVTTVFFLASCKKDEKSAERVLPEQTQQNLLKINQLQSIGSHNSYHIRMDDDLFEVLQNFNAVLPDEFKIDEGLYYTHETLQDQLSKYNVRNLEIDIYNDEKGGKFFLRKGNVLIGKDQSSGLKELREPGLKVLHIPDIDFKTHCLTFKDMMRQVKAWSEVNYNHVPIVILIEPKETTVGDVLGPLGFAKATPFGPEQMDNIDAEIKEIFGEDLNQLITPDDVRGSYSTLEEAVLAGNWPTLGASRGKFIFVMIGSKQDIYAEGHPSLAGRAMFATFDPGRPEAAFVKLDGALSSKAEIIDAVAKGYMVRTRSDDPGRENFTGDYSKRDAAFESGAQVISTDYYRPDERYLTNPLVTNYTVQLPGGFPARVNPISAPDKVNIGPILE